MNIVSCKSFVRSVWVTLSLTSCPCSFPPRKSDEIMSEILCLLMERGHLSAFSFGPSGMPLDPVPFKAIEEYFDMKIRCVHTSTQRLCVYVRELESYLPVF